MTLKELREKLSAKQDELHQVFEESKTDDGQYDFTKVKCLGTEVKGSVAVAEKVAQMNAELDDLARQAETLEAAEEAAKSLDARMKAVKRPPHVAPEGGTGGGRKALTKSLGELVTGEKRYQDWADSGCGGGLTFNFHDVLPSEALAKAAAFETMGSKTLLETGAGYAPESIRLPGFVEAVSRPIQLLDIIPLAQTSYETIKYMEETTRTHAAAEKAEGAAFAESTFVFTERTSPVQKITDSLPVTDEQLEDVAMISSYINGRLSFGVRQRLDGQSLIGNGTPPNLRGLKNVSGIQTQAKGADPAPDAFYKGMVKVRITGRAIPTHHVIHPTDWQNIRLLRTADGVYIWGSPSEAGPMRLWGLPVVEQDADSAATGYTGSFMPAWCSLFEKRGIDIQVGYVGTQFTEGKRTVRADARFAIVFFRPAAFCSVTGL